MFRMKADGGYTMTTGAILFYTGVAMVAVAVLAGIPVMLILRHTNQRIRRQIYTDFH